MNTRITALIAAAAFASVSHGAPRVVESIAIGDVTFGDAATNIPVNASTGATVSALGLTGQWEFVSGDIGGGLFPWSLDMTIDITAPNGPNGTWGRQIGGDVTIADYPIADYSPAIFNASPGAGAWNLAFRNDPAAGGVSRLAGGTVHLMEEVADQTFDYVATPDEDTSWDRPFFIEGTSGLGPTSYHVLPFTVSESGGYNLHSELSTGGNHFTFLYEGSFDDQASLDNLLDYGLGNGFSPFGVPQGESEIDALLFSGVTYFWVTSTWQASSPIVPSANTITGPGVVTVIPSPATLALLLAPVALRRRR